MAPDPYEHMCKALDRHAIEIAAGKHARDGVEAVRGAIADAGRDALGLVAMIDTHRLRLCICGDEPRKAAHQAAIDAFTALVAEVDQILPQATRAVVQAANGRSSGLVAQTARWERLVDERGGSWFATEARLELARQLDLGGHHHVADMLLAHAEFLVPDGLHEAVLTTRLAFARTRRQDLHPHYLRLLEGRDGNTPTSIGLWLNHQAECCDSLPARLVERLEATWSAMAESGYVGQRLLADAPRQDRWREDADWWSFTHRERPADAD